MQHRTSSTISDYWVAVPMQHIRRVLYLSDRRYIAIKLYLNGLWASPITIYDSDGKMTKEYIEPCCLLSDRALYEQLDSDDERYNDYWIGRLLCQ